MDETARSLRGLQSGQVSSRQLEPPLSGDRVRHAGSREGRVGAFSHVHVPRVIWTSLPGWLRHQFDGTSCRANLSGGRGPHRPVGEPGSGVFNARSHLGGDDISLLVLVIPSPTDDDRIIWDHRLRVCTRFEMIHERIRVRDPCMAPQRIVHSWPFHQASIPISQGLPVAHRAGCCSAISRMDAGHCSGGGVHVRFWSVHPCAARAVAGSRVPRVHSRHGCRVPGFARGHLLGLATTRRRSAHRTCPAHPHGRRTRPGRSQGEVFSGRRGATTLPTTGSRDGPENEGS